MNDSVFGTAVIRRISAIFLMLLLLFSSSVNGQQEQKPEKSARTTKAASSTAPPFHEDWTNLTLEHSTLQLKLPTLLGKEDFPGKSFVRELYEVNWRPDDPFDLYVVLPKGVKNPPVIFYLYTLPDDTQIYKNDGWCEGVTSGGYAAVGMVSALVGHRARTRLGKEWFVSELQEALATTTHDVQLVLGYLAARGDVDMTRVGMFGVGSGGAITILASAADSRIRAVDLLGPWGDWPTWLEHSKVVPDNERPNYTKPEFLSKVAPLDPVTWLAKVKAKSMRIQDVRTDTSMPNEAQDKLEAAAPEFALINQYGNKRSFMTYQPQSLLLYWLKEQLKPDAKPQVVAAKSERIHSYPAIESPAVAPSADKPKDKDKEKDKASSNSNN